MTEKEIESLPSVTEILGKTIAPREELIRWIREVEKRGQSSLAVMQKAARRGTKIHKLSSLLSTKQKTEIPKVYQERLQTLQTYLSQKKNLQTEILCWKEGEVSYKGHIDYLYEDERGLVLADLKTGNRLQKTHELQLFGYKDAIEFSKNISINILELLHLTSERLKVVEIPYKAEVWNSVLELYKYLYM